MVERAALFSVIGRSGTSAAVRWTPASGCTADQEPDCRCCRHTTEPRVAGRVDRQGPLRRDEVVVDVAAIQGDLQRSSALGAGSSTGSVFLPLYWGDPSSRRAIVVPISSTWLISSVPTPCRRSL